MQVMTMVTSVERRVYELPVRERPAELRDAV